MAILCLLLFALLPFAQTTPPQPQIAGIYGEADQDDVVGLLVDEGLGLANTVPAAGQAVLAKSRLPSPAAKAVVIASALSTLRLRSPPSR